MKSIIVVIGPGSIGQAIARRVGAGKHVLLADLRPENAKVRSPAIASARSPPSRTRRSRRRLLNNSSRSRSCSPIRSRTRCTRTSSRSAGTRCA